MGVLLAAALLRFWGLGSADILHDEGVYGFRAIGYLDFMSNDSQTTPIQWYKAAELPAWTKLSMHDHPPLYFLIGHIFSFIFGNEIWALRLPSAMAGVFSVWLMFRLVGCLARDEYAGLLAALILALNSMHVWISRAVLMESLLVMFLLALFNAWLVFLENKNRWIGLGLMLGLAALTKYTFIFLPATFALYAAIFRRDLFCRRETYLALILALAVFLPVIVYNIFLYGSRGHFDLQWSYLFGQATPEWTASFGKLQEPFSAWWVNMTGMYSIVFMLAAAGALIYTIIRFYLKREAMLLIYPLMLISVTLVLVGIGSAERFISLYLVPAVPAAAVFAIAVFKRWRGEWVAWAGFAAFFIFELAFTISVIFAAAPDFGILKLDRYLEEVIGGGVGMALPESPNPHLDAVIKNYARRLERNNRRILLIYDENISLSQRLWLFLRRTMYKGITTMNVRFFESGLAKEGASPLAGYELYFVRATDATLLNPYLKTNDAERFERYLRETLGLEPLKIVVGRGGLPMFYVYRF